MLLIKFMWSSHVTCSESLIVAVAEVSGKDTAVYQLAGSLWRSLLTSFLLGEFVERVRSSEGVFQESTQAWSLF